MFGDLGHGCLMFLFAGFLVLREKPLAAKKTDNEVYNYRSYINKKLNFLNYHLILLTIGMEYILCWTLHNITYGSFFYVYWFYLQ